jgi:adenylate kinase family enzyme
MIDNKEISNLTGAIVLRVPHGELWKRLMERKRVDDTRAAIERREDLYERSVTGMIRALSMEDVLVREVDGMGTPEDVLERISEVLGEWGLVPRKQYTKISEKIRIDYKSRV